MYYLRIASSALLFIVFLILLAMAQSPLPTFFSTPSPLPHSKVSPDGASLSTPSSSPSQATTPDVSESLLLRKDTLIVVQPNPMPAKVKFYKNGKLVFTGVTRKQYSLEPGRYTIVVIANESYFTYWKVELPDYDLNANHSYDLTPTQKRVINWPLISAIIIISFGIASYYYMKNIKEKDREVIDAKTAFTRARTLTRVDGMPEFIGKYSVVERIGVGAMATVYKVKDEFDDVYALKVPHSHIFSIPEFRSRFIREAEIVKNLHHPNIVRMYDYNMGEDYTIPYICLEFVTGTTLRKYLDEHPHLPIKQILNIMIYIASAIGYAHSKGVIHRDIKPENIMITAKNEIKVMDLGIARAQDSKTLTSRDVTLGTPYYIAPEQVNIEKVDGRADLYSMGVLFYEMLTTRLPFKTDDTLGVILKHLHEPPEPPTIHNTNIPKPLENVVLKLLEKDPGDRFQTAEELVLEIKKFL